MFITGQFYTRKQIYNEVGGSIQSYLPTVRKEVVCACLRKDLNPDAPNIILVGNCPRVKLAAEILCSQSNPIPVFIKIKTNKWEHIGLYKVDSFSKDPEEISDYSKRSDRKNITAIIYLSKVLR
ncbi:MAG: hypothetical protein KJ957_07930 [Candidatus Omnitrophica bacterium]|nr:hypothetical protein [Candidatus Omnitrophota bacterium]MBU1853956.1 hypothetical protein [Candidatus Omnitrophota bacterium]